MTSQLHAMIAISVSQRPKLLFFNNFKRVEAVFKAFDCFNVPRMAHKGLSLWFLEVS